jgi:murein DD-endopeptidase MepM/ murein hydrolase activator NlpD
MPSNITRSVAIAGALIAMSFLVVANVRSVRAQQTSTVKEIFDLNRQITEKKDHADNLRAKISQLKSSISREQGNVRTLMQQVSLLDDRIEQKRLILEETMTEREQVELEIQATALELGQVRERLDRQRALLSALLIELRRADVRAPLSVLLSGDSIGAYFSFRNQLTQLNGNMERILVSLRGNNEVLEASERALEAREDELVNLAERLGQEQVALDEEQDSKERLLTTTRRNEQRYQSMVADLKREQDAIEAEIVSFETRVRKQLESIDSSFGASGRVAFSWPVPNRGITTYFYDPEYPFRNIFEHPGLDLRAAQGIPILASAPGYVAKAKDAGYGYSYLMLIHPGGFSSVYGHVSCFKVEEGTYVNRGDPIACVGGKPGSRGAGRFTTGAHVHYEIRQNGIPVDPLNYLL